MKMLTTGQVAALFGVDPTRISDWKRRRLIAPTISSTNRKPDLYSPELALRIGMVVCLRRRGLPLQSCIKVYRALSGRSIEDMEACFAYGKTHLAIDQSDCIPKFVTPWEIAGSAFGGDVTGLGQNLAVVDLSAAVRILREFVSQLPTDEAPIADQAAEPQVADPQPGKEVSQ
jgi:DNA-binding transcriptional MerR regulator